MLFLAGNPSWKAKATEEVQSLISKHVSDSGTLASRLSQVPPSAWEHDMPVMEVIIQETIRLLSGRAALRRNIKEDISIEGKIVERGAFMAHPSTSVHFDPAVYTNPTEFDPGRFEKGREEDKKVTFGFLGWGAGAYFSRSSMGCYYSSLVFALYRPSSMPWHAFRPAGAQSYHCAFPYWL